jgi:hypothetical protein
MKNQLIYRLLQLGLLTFCLFIVTSCGKKELGVPLEGKVALTMDWKNLYSGESIPSAMKLYFYKSDGSVTIKDCDGSGFTGTLSNGTYQVIAYNTDATGVAYRDLYSYSGAQAYATAQTKATYMSQPSHAYGVGLGALVINSDVDAVAAMTPISYVKKAKFAFALSGQKSAVASCNATLSGLAQSVNIATGEFQAETGTISFTSTKTDTGFTSTVSFFGCTASSKSELAATLNFTSGSSQTITLDVSSDLAAVISSGSIVPVDVNLNIEVTGSVAAGFHATLKSWSIDNKTVTAE